VFVEPHGLRCCFCYSHSPDVRPGVRTCWRCRLRIERREGFLASLCSGIGTVPRAAAGPAPRERPEKRARVLRTTSRVA
jgi:hypothetical protein